MGLVANAIMIYFIIRMFQDIHRIAEKIAPKEVKPKEETQWKKKWL